MNLDELQKLCDEATSGPWSINIDHMEMPHYEQRLRSIGPITYWASHADDAGLDVCENDAQFISAARTYMPLLIEIAKAAGNEALLWNESYCSREDAELNAEAQNNLVKLLDKLKELK